MSFKKKPTLAELFSAVEADNAGEDDGGSVDEGAQSTNLSVNAGAPTTARRQRPSASIVDRRAHLPIHMQTAVASGPLSPRAYQPFVANVPNPTPLVPFAALTTKSSCTTAHGMSPRAQSTMARNGGRSSMTAYEIPQANGGRSSMTAYEIPQAKGGRSSMTAFEIPQNIRKTAIKH